MSDQRTGATPDPIQQLENFGSGGIAVSPMDPAAVRRLGDKRRRRQNTLYGAIAAVVVAAAVVPAAVLAARDDAPSGTPIAPTTPTPTPSPSPTSSVIVFPGEGVTIKAPEDTALLVGTSEEFQTFIRGVLREQGCQSPEINVMKYSTDGFGLGSVTGCGSHQALWVLADGAWEEAQGTQDEWVCSDLAKYEVPEGFAGDCSVPKPPPAVVDFGDRGVEVISRGDVDKLEGTTDDFKQFILATALPEAKAELAMCQKEDPAYFDPDKGGLSVARFARAGYALGAVDGCSGYSAIWKKVDGTWREVLASQERWVCADLERERIPRSFVGGHCFQ